MEDTTNRLLSEEVWWMRGSCLLREVRDELVLPFLSRVREEPLPGSQNEVISVICSRARRNLAINLASFFFSSESLYSSKFC